MSSDNQDSRYGGPRATVTEVDGTISTSVEETNRIRTLLGLKPLRQGPPKEQREEVDASSVPTPKPTAYEVRQRIAESRGKRTREELTTGPSLGERLAADDENVSDSAAWVARMRRRKVQESSSIRKISKRIEDEDESEEEVIPSDLKVIHKMSEFDLKAGDEMILTLKDRRLIDEEGELDETEDLLENQDLVSKAKRDKLKNEKNRKTVYNPFDEDSDDVVGTERKREVLPHYDDWAVEAKMVKKPKGADAIGAVRLSDIAMKNRSEEISKGASLTSVVGVQKDFMTPAEVEIARKKAVLKIQKERKRNGKNVIDRTRRGGDEGEVNVGNFVESFNPEIRRPPKPTDDIDHGPEDLDDAALYEQLAKRRNVTVEEKHGSKEEQSVLNAVVLVKKFEAVKLEEETTAAAFAAGIHLVGLVDVTPEELGTTSLAGSPNVLEFTSTTEFCRALETPFEKLQNLKAEQEKQKVTLRSKRGIATVDATITATTAERTWRDDAGVQMDGTESAVDVKEQGAENEESDGEELTEQEEKAVELLVSENLLDGGVTSALNMLKSRGELTDDTWRLGRRSGENKPLHQSTNQNDIKIEYKDEFGRVLGPKDAFRYISWAFHGKGPGKKKREKLLRKIETEKKKKAIAQNANMLPTMQALRKQQKMGQAHVVLSSSSNTH